MGKRDDLIRIQRESTSQTDFIRKLRAAGYDAEANQQEFGSGLLSTGVGLVTGIPDIGIEAYNWATDSKVPTLRQRALQAINAPTEPSTPEGSIAYNTPEVASLMYGLASLGKLGVKGIRQFFANKKTAKVLDVLDQTDLGVLQKYALKGQGGESRDFMEVLDKLSKSPKYGEIVASLRAGATAEAIKGMAPSASKLKDIDAATSAAQAVSNRLKGLKEAKDTAGDIAFTKAFGYAGGQKIVDTENTLAKIRGLRSEFAKGNTSSSDAAVKFLDDLESRLVPSGTTASYPGKAVTETVTTMERDASGMLRPVSRERTASVPGSAGYSFSYGPQKQTLEAVQSMLTQFGKEASSGQGLIKDVTLSDQQRIAASIFGGLKDDLRASAKLANDAGDLNAQRGIEAMMKGHSAVSKAYDAYNQVLNQKIPTWLKDKQLSQVNFDDLLNTYKSIPPEQRVAFRNMVGDTDAEALKALDNRVWDDFISSTKIERDDGTRGIDIGAMADKWFSLMEQKTDRNAADALAMSLGTNLPEFTQRMSDALKFTRQIKTSGEKKDLINPQLARNVSATLGASLGYRAKQATDLSVSALNNSANKFSLQGMDEDFLMKILLTPEGKDFLKSSRLSKDAQKTLMALDKVKSITPDQFKAPVASFSSSVSAMGAPDGIAPQDQGVPKIDLSVLGSGTAVQEPTIDLSVLQKPLTPSNMMSNSNVAPTIQLDSLINRLQPTQ